MQVFCYFKFFQQKTTATVAQLNLGRDSRAAENARLNLGKWVHKEDKHDFVTKWFDTVSSMT